MCIKGTTKVVQTPEWLWSERANPVAGISLDWCIADQILDAWKRGVRTLGSCCGHGERPSSVVLVSDPMQISLAKVTLPSDWIIYQWQLTIVN